MTNVRSRDQAQVDTQLDAIGEGIQAGGRVVTVQPEIEGEVVAGARRDDHHRDVPARGDTRHQGLGSVAAGDPEQVGPAVDRLPGERGHVDDPGTFEQGHLGAERGGLVVEPEFRDLPAARPWVHDHKWLPRRRRRMFAWFVGQGATAQCRAPGGHRDDGEHDAERDLPQQPGNDIHDDHEHRRGDQHREREPAPDAAVGQEPPRRRAGDGQSREAKEQRGDAPQRTRHQEHHDRGGGGREREPGQPALAPAGTG